MPRTKQKTKPQPATPKPATVATPQPPSPQPAVLTTPTGEVFTLAKAAAYLRLSENDVMTLVHSQGLPGRWRRIAGEWRFLKSAIQQRLAAAQPTTETRKSARLAIVGTWKDDPFLEDMLEEIYRRRGRPITENGSYRLFPEPKFEEEQK
jgi:hypothetical protein